MKSLLFFKAVKRIRIVLVAANFMSDIKLSGREIEIPCENKDDKTTRIEGSNLSHILVNIDVGIYGNVQTRTSNRHYQNARYA